MQIVCPNCATSYEVQAAAFGNGGRSVRCARCRTVWLATAAAPAMEMAAAPAPMPSARPPGPEATPAAVSFYDPPRPEQEADDGLAKAAARDPETEWVDARVDQALADATERRDNQQASSEAEPAPAPAMAAADTTAVDDGPPLAPAMPDEAPAVAEQAAPARPPMEDIESFAARRIRLAAARHQKRKWPRPNLATAIMVLLVLVSVLIGWRNDVVRLMPQTASFFSSIGLGVNMRGLAFADVKTSREQHDGVNVLVVEGRIVSQVPKPIPVPRLRFAVRNEAGQEVYTWTALPKRSILGPGESLPFRSRLASPPPDTRTVLIRFFNRSDIVAGSR